LPNIKSAKKRVAVTERKALRNKMAKSSLKTSIKKAQVAAAGGDAVTAGSAFVSAQKAIDQAVAKGILHKNTAARRKSRLALSINKG
jgi:small subunit ribosomal protein S20